ncbi:2629_t:CDS:1, partial [Dentiscutata heterogama]
DPENIQTNQQYIFPINNTNIAKSFLDKIQGTYSFNISLPPEYISVNPTNKPILLVNPKNITKMNLTIPINTPKQLVNIAREL